MASLSSGGNDHSAFFKPHNAKHAFQCTIELRQLTSDELRAAARTIWPSIDSQCLQVIQTPPTDDPLTLPLPAVRSFTIQVWPLRGGHLFSQVRSALLTRCRTPTWAEFLQIFKKYGGRLKKHSVILAGSWWTGQSLSEAQACTVVSLSHPNATLTLVRHEVEKRLPENLVVLGMQLR